MLGAVDVDGDAKDKDDGMDECADGEVVNCFAFLSVEFFEVAYALGLLVVDMRYRGLGLRDLFRCELAEDDVATSVSLD